MSGTGMKDLDFTLGQLEFAARQERRNMQMPGDGRYQPAALIPYLGYDQWADWLIIVEWFWLKTLAVMEVVPQNSAKLLTDKCLSLMLASITTTEQDRQEKITKHDILALLALMRQYLPKELVRWLHYCATSYDIINTAYALQIKVVFEKVFVPQLKRVDEIWRQKIDDNAHIIQAGRTHLQTALPITVGFWLAGLHNRFVQTARRANTLSGQIPGKFCGAVGTSASQRVLIKSREGEKIIMEMLGLPVAEVCTQITPPEATARFYHEMLLLSGVMANLGEDVRILQSSQFGEVTSHSSTSSAMSHKTGNPILAENVTGMHVNVVAEFSKITTTLISDLQRDLRWSCVMRSYSAMLVYVYQQLVTTERLLKSLNVNHTQCGRNFEKNKYVVPSELLHLALQREGLEHAHDFVNQVVIPEASIQNEDLLHVIAGFDESEIPPELVKWREKPTEIGLYLEHPESYTGDAIEIAQREAKNEL
jgi:adenylosuccinate lyase